MTPAATKDSFHQEFSHIFEMCVQIISQQMYHKQYMYTRNNVQFYYLHSQAFDFRELYAICM